LFSFIYNIKFQVAKPKSIMNFFGKKAEPVTPSSPSQNVNAITSKKSDGCNDKFVNGIASGEDKCALLYKTFTNYSDYNLITVVDLSKDPLATPLVSQNSQNVITPSSEMEDSVPEIDRLITGDDKASLTTERSVDDLISRDPKMTLFKDTISLSNVSTMPPLAPRFKETKKRKAPTSAAKKDKDSSSGSTVTLNEDGIEVVSEVVSEEASVSDEKKTPKKRVTKPKAAAVTPSSDAETVDGSEGGDATDGTTTPVKVLPKRVRKPNVKKIPVSDGIAAVAVGEDSVVGADTIVAATEEDGLSACAALDVDESVSASVPLTPSAPVESEDAPSEPSSSVKKPRKKNNALKALESYNNTGGKEVMAEKRVAVQVDYTDASLSAIDALLKSDEASSKSPSATKTTIAASVVNAYFTAEGSAAACSFDSIAPSVAGHVSASSVSSAMAMEKVLRELPAEVVAKIALNRDRMATLLGEMIALEG
jgi:hypothetical protein